jgi:hypothetical protein
MARATRDLDFTVRSKPGGAGDMILALLHDVGAMDTGDHFTFRTGEAGKDLDGAPNSRERDLVDLALLVRSGIMDTKRTTEASGGTFAWRGTHNVPDDLAPPESWSATFAAMAEECSPGLDATTAFQEVAAYLREVRPRTQ